MRVSNSWGASIRHAQKKGQTMMMAKWIAVLVGLVVLARSGPTRDERGLSQSAENAILLAGAVTVAGVVIAVITAFVKAKMPQL